MPTYEYECDKCGRFEVKQSMSDSPLTACPECGGPVRKVMSPSVGIAVKGGGEAPPCGRQSPCCGRDAFCGRPPCNE